MSLDRPQGSGDTLGPNVHHFTAFHQRRALLTTQSFARAKGNTSGTGTSVPKVASPDGVSQVGSASVTAFTRLGGSWRLVVLLPRSE